MIDPSRFAEDAADHAPFSKQIEPKSDAEAVRDWEDEGGLYGPSESGNGADDLFPARPNESKKD